jgi:hypothetical protein
MVVGTSGKDSGDRSGGECVVVECRECEEDRTWRKRWMRDKIYTAKALRAAIRRCELTVPRSSWSGWYMLSLVALPDRWQGLLLLVRLHAAEATRSLQRKRSRKRKSVANCHMLPSLVRCKAQRCWVWRRGCAGIGSLISASASFLAAVVLAAAS